MIVGASVCCLAPAASCRAAGAAPFSPIQGFKTMAPKVEAELVARYGEAERTRIQRGLRQVGDFWRAADGDAAALAAFVRRHFAGDRPALDALFGRFQRLMEKLDGHMAELRYELRLETDLDRSALLPADEIFSGYEPAAHLSDDFFGNKLAFVVLLNFPLTTLEERLNEGPKWSRRQWAEVRLAQRFSKRIPAEVLQAVSQSQADAELYINQYKICMHHLLDAAGGRPFPPGLRLVAHWNLRDEIKAQYSEGPRGLARQRMIQRVLERIIDQSIPQAVIDNPRVDWDPQSNAMWPSPVNEFGPEKGTGPICRNGPEGAAHKLDLSPFPTQEPRGPKGDSPIFATMPRMVPAKMGTVPWVPEPDTRYAKWLAVFRANRRVDPYSPAAPTLIARRFEEDRQMSEARVRAMLEQVLTSPEFAAVGRLVQQRLGRPLEPFDIWYNGFRAPLKHSEAELDAMVRRRYPTAAAFRGDLPNILVKLGFSPERAAYLRGLIDVEAARGTGHAMGGAMRGQLARLRTHVDPAGMNYKGFNIALHELGHNIEQTFSLNQVDDTLLAGVPNTAFTEALAMITQGRDLEVLGLAAPDARSEALKTLNDFWATAEISGMALVDMAAWHWMYEHPEATPAELKAATLATARELWNRYYAPVFGRRDVTLLAVYSHMIRDVLYLPDYPIGHLIAFQIEAQMKKSGHFAAEFERMARFGNLTPDLWMQNASGAPVGAEALLSATKRALAEVGKL
jgi:hypothetical protein